MDLLGGIEHIKGMHMGNMIIVPSHYYYPGFWVVLAAFCRLHHIHPDQVIFEGSDNETYSNAIGLSRALGVSDGTSHTTQRTGVTFSPLVHLASSDSVDSATSTINGCLNALTGDIKTSGMQHLKHVIGELHDNVWSHGLSSGFSMAQKSRVPGADDYYIEFAVADAGLGFCEETRRARIPSIHTDQDAIEWCMQKGNTTKPAPVDEWAQTLPDDALGNPLTGAVTTIRHQGSHHQGLGLAQLAELATSYNGELYVISGSAALHIKGDKRNFLPITNGWKGVAISCRLRQSSLITVHSDSQNDPSVLEIIKLLGG
jgi:hypothetical protein